MIVHLKLGCNANKFYDPIRGVTWEWNDIREYPYEYLTPNIERALLRKILVYATSVEYAQFINHTYSKNSMNCDGLESSTPAFYNEFNDDFNNDFD